MSATHGVGAMVVATHVWPESHDVPKQVDPLELDWGGPVGDRHHGLTMAANTRQKAVFARGTEIRNHRQISIVDEAELAEIAVSLGIPTLQPGLLADNICTRGIPEMTSLPRMTRLVFSRGPVIMLGGENLPCTIAGGLVEARHGVPAATFPRAAMGLRGVTGWVEHPGQVRPGDPIEVVLPSRGS